MTESTLIHPEDIPCSRPRKGQTWPLMCSRCRSLIPTVNTAVFLFSNNMVSVYRYHLHCLRLDPIDFYYGPSDKKD